jgi:hypothetical protein
MSLHDNNQQVQITLTILQAQALVDALEAYSRLGLGQIRYLAELVHYQEIPTKKCCAESAQEKLRLAEIADRVEVQCQIIQEILGFEKGESHGLGGRCVSTKAMRAYEIKKVVERELAMWVNPHPVLRGTHYDGLTVRYTEDPAPGCSVSASSLQKPAEKA